MAVPDAQGALEGIARLEKRLARERQARKEAEQIAESTLREVYLQQQALELLGAAARAANERATAHEALKAAVDAVCAFMGWPVGHAVLLHDGELRSARVWNTGLDEGFAAFKEASERAVFVPGAGLPGRVLESHGAAWIERVDLDPSFPRQAAAQDCGLACGFAFPIVSGGELLGVIELFTTAPMPVDERILELLAQVGLQVGRALEREHAHDALERARDELQAALTDTERSNAELEAFAYVASHDLQEPLRTITGFAQLLSRRYTGQLDEQADEWIAFVVGGAARMRQLIDDLLGYSRVGRSDLPLAPVDLAAVMGSVTDDLRTAITESGARVEVGALPVVAGDAGQLKQVLANLVSNALKYRSEATPIVRVGAHRVDDAWRVEVRDNGIGIAPKDAGRAFELFKRINPSADVAGTGIGLAICAKILERHGGTIRVDPGPDGGSVFAFTLPPPGDG